MGETPDAPRSRARDRACMTITTHTSIAAGLRAHGFVGRVVEPADLDYDAARAGWNAAIDRRPAAVAFATDADDVAAAIRAARMERIPFTIRAGAHSVSGRSVRDAALCIDLRTLNELFLLTQPAHLQKIQGRKLEGDLRRAARADFIRQKLNGAGQG